MEVPAASAFSRKLGAAGGLTEADRVLVERLQHRRRSFAIGRDLVHQGRTNQSAFILVTGWVCSYKLQNDGSRQIVDVRIPGDVLGLRNLVLRTCDLGQEPITPCEAAEVQGADLADAFAQSPRVAAAVLWAAARDEAVVSEHLVGLGRRDAAARMAHFLLELGVRLGFAGIGDAKGYDCPLTQYHLADALGLSAIHVNRTLRMLREQGLLVFRDGAVSFQDYQGLISLAGFDPAYLDHRGPERYASLRDVV